MAYFVTYRAGREDGSWGHDEEVGEYRYPTLRAAQAAARQAGANGSPAKYDNDYCYLTRGGEIWIVSGIPLD